MLQKIGHVGLWVRNAQATLEGLCRVLSRPPVLPRVVEDRKLKFGQIDLGGIQIEVIEDLDPAGPVAEQVAQKGDFIHHVCLVSDDIDADVAGLRERGMGLAAEAPKMGVRGKRVIFTVAETSGGVPVEISEP